ncbi:probable protein phosphatase 2C 4 [Vigna umbellata]|uniref:probable protein phosphatase 2C 4 n=1 Tax=Vigna umbellata TaxID=87088 RepID=UPI001F5FA78E|nr:probable protein phosphatase 2C 4 [Vigna umbellata]XP_047174574.1 probable protein phosphatase 2C 4 [Vigna umbellata]
MGNGIGKLTVCFTGHNSGGRRKQDISILITEPLDEGLGHSFCYVRPDPTRISSSKVHSEETTTFRTISGASVSANTSTPLSTAFVDLYSYGCIDRAAAFESSTSFASLPLQPIPRNLVNSGPFSGNLGGGGFPGSGPLERGFMSGPIERGFMSGPIDRGLFSGPMEREGNGSDHFPRSFSHGGMGLGLGLGLRVRTRKGRWIRVLQRAISKTLSRGQNSIVAPIKGVVVKEPEWMVAAAEKHNENLSVNLSSEGSLEDDDSMESQNLQWAQGKAGEDRVHVVVSEEHGWVFVGIYDGFNGPDAPDYLLSNLYTAVHKELKGLLWDDGSTQENSTPKEEVLRDVTDVADVDACSHCVEHENSNCNKSTSKKGRNSRNRYKGAANKWEENQRRWKCEWDRERLELDRRLKEQLNSSRSGCGGAASSINHADVLEALSRALRKTEESYLDVADKMVMENPELALMGSCVLVMLMKGEDVYVMNVGDSRAVLAQKAEPDYWLGKIRQDLERINEETMNDLESWDVDNSNLVPSLSAIQLTKDHSTSVEEEIQRIKKEHPDDPCAVVNDRVKGSLKVTRAFGAGFLKQPKWNNALLEMFRIDYVGNSPYISCLPYLKHHRLGPKDKFLILCSDGLYQYLSNEEAVAEVEHFITLQPEGDPAQHLVEEVLFRAAKKAGLVFHELLEIPQGDRRRYHDDVSIIVISLEGRIWRSCV